MSTIKKNHYVSISKVTEAIQEATSAIKRQIVNVSPDFYQKFNFCGSKYRHFDDLYEKFEKGKVFFMRKHFFCPNYHLPTS